MSIPSDITRSHPEYGDLSILTAWRGSIAHGMFVPSTEPTSIDDRDVIAICVPSIEHYFGRRVFGSRGTKELKQDEWDLLAYEARKAIGLLRAGNPNILSVLWLNETSYMKVTPAGRLLLDERELFVGRWVFKPFVGYARDQMHKMTHQAGLGYLGAKRRKLVEQFGYDTKNAAHMVRLLRMAIELLNTGTMAVDRGGFDATELLDIKRGEWKVERVLKEGERLFRRAEDAYDRSTLPMQQDDDAINALSVEIVRTALEERTELTKRSET